MSSIILLNDHKPQSSLVQKAIMIRELKLDRDRAVKAYEVMKDAIIKEMGDLTVILDNNDCELITYSERVENRFNAKKFEMDFADIYAAYKEQQVVRVFNVK